MIASPQNKLDKRGRASGWRGVPLEKKARQQWLALLATVKDKGIQNVYGSDLDAEAVHAAGNELHINARHDYRFRRFNVGSRLHAKPLDIVDAELQRMNERWLKNPDIPVREGDSLTSYRNRFFKAIDELIAKNETALFISDPLTLRSIKDREPKNWKLADTGIRRDKVYQVNHA